MIKDKKKSILLAIVLLIIVIFIVFPPAEYLNLAVLKSNLETLNTWRAEKPWLAGSIFFLLYALVTALSVPGAILLTLLSGALFGLALGSVLTSFASTLGATLAMLISRFLLYDWVQQRFQQQLGTIDRGIKQDGAFYLFALRLIPIFPFFLINLAVGITRLPVRTFWWVSQLGMLPSTLLYVNAGRELAQITSLAGIFTPGLIGAFALLGLLPLISHKALSTFKRRKLLEGWHKPTHFDRNLVVIGAGSGGLVSAYVAAAAKAKVTLIEKGDMGGDCLNTGCVPSKALIRAARLANDLKHAEQLGFRHVCGQVDFSAVMERVQQVIQRIEPHDSVERYSQLGVEVIQGKATVTSPWSVEVNGQHLSTRSMIIATGSRPVIPDIPGLEQVDALTTDTIWTLREQPQRLLILGGGPIGCELAQAFQRLGCAVTLVERGAQVLKREDREASETVMHALRADGVDVRLQHRAIRFDTDAGKHQLICHHQSDNQEVSLPFDRVLLALGRVANVSGFGLEMLSLAVRENGTLETDEYLATRFPHIFAVGDVTGPYQFTHASAHQAWYAAINGLFGQIKRFKVDYRVMPWATFTDPEVARVGLNEQEAGQQGIAYEISRFELGELDRAITENAAHGYIQVLTEPGRDRILGVTVVGEQASEVITEYVTAIKQGYGLNKILGTIHIYPTLSEANKYVAGVWRKAHTPQWLMRGLARFHHWRLGGKA
ncbi:FAD-dependent oxidoreductase [Serratia sp. UGAL515B_01]|uniref:FAD-dependent oxidoreductase n=1 Tax=Serratia sp. UGAL515B_01 TaxID=2986763 RepID=UPI0029556398|nr:FAD-dependent oxidoreductase [Serratia sp. UGAL515B_01]WON77727.1 FAD-dependent oxidoreductase [Serratia sp. UGAL515B_01]